MEQLAKYKVRRAADEDLSKIVQIERDSFERPWSRDDFKEVFRRQNSCLVAEEYGIVVGFILFTLSQTSVDILNLAVDWGSRRKLIGTVLVDRLKNRLSEKRRRCIRVDIRERNLPAQLFLKKQGFRAVSTVHNHYEDTGEDCYVMRYSLDEQVDWHVIADGEPQLHECADGRILATTE